MHLSRFVIICSIQSLPFSVIVSCTGVSAPRTALDPGKCRGFSCPLFSVVSIYAEPVLSVLRFLLKGALIDLGATSGAWSHPIYAEMELGFCYRGTEMGLLNRLLVWW